MVYIYACVQGVVASGIAFAVQIWCIDRGGPVFVAVYQPVQTFVVALMASFALGEEFYLGGSVLSFSPSLSSFIHLISFNRHAHSYSSILHACWIIFICIQSVIWSEHI